MCRCDGFLVMLYLAALALAAPSSAEMPRTSSPAGQPARQRGAMEPAKTIFAFHGKNGANPVGTFALGANDAIYGITSYGGSVGWGTVFALERTAGAGYRHRVLHSFAGGSKDGMNPSDLIMWDGNLYGTTGSGGSGSCDGGCGTVFQLKPSGKAFVETILYDFQGGPADAASPHRLIVDRLDGTIYGTALSGGPCGCGAIFRLKRANGRYAETILYDFQGAPTDGNGPSSLVLGAHGVLTGTTYLGGPNWCQLSSSGGDCGVVFQLTPAVSRYVESILYNFRGAWDGAVSADGASPNRIIAGANGTFYGTTSVGGAGNAGTFFELQRSGTGYAESVVHSFGGTGDGKYPSGSLTFDGRNLYGTTGSGGSHGSECDYGGCGTIFELAPSGSKFDESVAYSFGGSRPGIEPVGVVVGPDGKLFGGTSQTSYNEGDGTLFAWKP